MSTFDGGSAYPRNDYFDCGNNYHCAEPGMSLRDYFAAKAMAMFHGLDITCDSDIRRRLDFSEAASLSYQYADAMLKERAK